MPKYKVSFTLQEDREVESDFYTDAGKFIDFKSGSQISGTQITVLRIRADDVESIEIVK